MFLEPFPDLLITLDAFLGQPQLGRLVVRELLAARGPQAQQGGGELVPAVAGRTQHGVAGGPGPASSRARTVSVVTAVPVVTSVNADSAPVSELLLWSKG